MEGLRERRVATRTTYERIGIAFDDSYGFDIEGVVVDYLDFESEEAAIGNVFTAVSTKDLPYRDEKEFRLLLWRHEYENPHLGPPPHGFRLHVDLTKLVERIYVSPRLDKLRGPVS